MVKPPARPFLKWAGGKAQLMEEFTRRVPGELKKGELPVFVEPFVGGGAVFFHYNSHFRFEECHIFDINEELVLAYTVVKREVEELIQVLAAIEKDFLSQDEAGRKQFFYDLRDEYNRKKPAINFSSFGNDWTDRAAQFIFLNRTCYNGLYRVNSDGWFNVPFGSYKIPKILNAPLLRVDSGMLQNSAIHLGDFAESHRYITDKSFVYCDPPYRPLSKTSCFTQYSRHGFTDSEQRRLAAFFRSCDSKKAKIMLSNSDPKNVDPEDDFFDTLYAEYHIARVPATRMINCDGSKRGEVREIIVTNYPQ